MGKQFAVFGLGSFGKSVALTLQSFGCDVIAVDNCYEKIQDIADLVRRTDSKAIINVIPTENFYGGFY